MREDTNFVVYLTLLKKVFYVNLDLSMIYGVGGGLLIYLAGNCSGPAKCFHQIPESGVPALDLAV